MSEQKPVMTVEAEVESILALCVQNAIHASDMVSEVTSVADEFHDAVIAELESVLEEYKNRGQLVEVPDDTIRVGDTVRTKSHPFYPDGTEFQVTEVVDGEFTPRSDNITRKFYVKGDPGRYGVWDIYLGGKVHA